MVESQAAEAAKQEAGQAAPATAEAVPEAAGTPKDEAVPAAAEASKPLPANPVQGAEDSTVEQEALFAEVVTAEIAKRLKKLPQVVIRSHVSGHVLQANGTKIADAVVLDYFTGVSEQVWYQLIHKKYSIFINKAAVE